MKIIDRTRIVILPNRQRQEFDPIAITELADSISCAHGLLHPIVLREPTPDDTLPAGAPASPLILVAGERRLRAMDQLAFLGKEFRCAGTTFSPGFVPGMLLKDLSPLEAEGAELDENIKRRDLTWQERAAATARLMKYQQKVADATGAPPPTFATVAQELKGRSDGGFQDTVRKDVLVAQHLDNPLVAKAKSADEAFKLLKQQETAKRNEALAEAVGKTLTAESHTLLNANCLEWLATCPDAQFDVILTDPPYGMNAHEFGDGAGRNLNTHDYDDSPEAWETLMNAWAPEAFRVAKPQAHAYVFCDFDKFHLLRSMMETAGWYVFRTPFIYHKLNSGRVPLPDRGPRRAYEILLYAIKGDKPVTQIYPDVIAAAPGSEDAEHGAQKPVALFQNLLMRSIRPGDKVLDTFGGTGPLLTAAHNLKCLATVIEQNTATYGIAVKRLQSLAQTANMGLDSLPIAQ